MAGSEEGLTGGKRRRLDVRSDEARARIECILREQLDLELYLKQREINAISTRLRHSEALLGVVESAIRAQCHAELCASDAADGLLGYFHRLSVAAAADRRQGDQRQLEGGAGSGIMLRERPRRAVAAGPTRHMADSYDAALGLETDGEGARSAPADAANSTGSRRRTPARTPRLGVLASKLDAEQMSSVADALEYIRRQRGPDADDSGSDSSDGSWSSMAGGRHPPVAGGSANGTSSILVQPSRESRFHVMRRVVLGNTSRFVAPQDRPPGMENSTHKWTFYLRSTSTDGAPGDYIRKVRVFLHPSYRPDDIVDLAPPSLELTRWGWGEFPIRVQVFFLDRRNKPVDLIHMIKLDDQCSGSEAAGPETPVDFELDRRWFTGDGRAEAATATHPLWHQAPPAQPANPILRGLFKALCALYPLVLDNVGPPGTRRPSAPKAGPDKLPIAGAGRWAWNVAASADVWRMSWPLGKRLAAESSRNRTLLSLLSAAFRDLEDPTSDPAPPASDASAKDHAERTTVAILRLAGANKAEADGVESIVRSSDDTACREAVDMLRHWAADYRVERPLRPDRTRAESQGQHGPALKHWLRLYGHVPLPVLCAAEHRACLPSQRLDRRAMGGGKVFAGASGPAAAAVATADTDYDAEPAATRRHARLLLSEFCHSCGVVVRCAAAEAMAAEPAAARTPAVHALQAGYCSAECASAGHGGYTTVTPASVALSALASGWDVPDDEDDVDAVVAVDNDMAPCPAGSDAAGSASGAPSAEIKDIAASLREYHLNEQCWRSLGAGYDGSVAGDGSGSDGDEMGAGSNAIGRDGSSGGQGAPVIGAAAADEAIDWIWSAIRPLELNCATASRLAITDDGGRGGALSSGGRDSLVRLPNGSDEAFEEALDQRLVVGRLLLDATKLFLRDLIAASDRTLRANRAACIAVDGSEPAPAAVDSRLLMLTPLHVLAAAKQDPQSFDVCSNAYLAGSDSG